MISLTINDHLKLAAAYMGLAQAERNLLELHKSLGYVSYGIRAQRIEELEISATDHIDAAHKKIRSRA